MIEDEGIMNFPDTTIAILVLACVCGIIGWAAIEAVLWVFSHINISWGK